MKTEIRSYDETGSTGLTIVHIWYTMLLSEVLHGCIARETADERIIITVLKRSAEMKNCIITGGSSGIGYQAARQIADKGYHVTLLCRNQKRAEKGRSSDCKRNGQQQGGLADCRRGFICGMFQQGKKQ